MIRHGDAAGRAGYHVLLSGIAYPASVPGKILIAWRHGSVEVLLSTYIVEELRRVLPRLAHRHHLTATEIDDLVDALSIPAELLEPSASAESALRDSGDQPVLGTLLAALETSRADYLITGDKDLLALADRYAIVTPAVFWATHAGL